MTTPLSFSLIFSLFLSVSAWADWTQFQGDARRSGNAPGEVLKASLGLEAAVPLTDGIYAAPVVSDGVAYVIDGSGVVFAIDTSTFKVKWRFVTHGGAGNCNNVAAPAVVGKYLHVGTTAGYYYVLNRETGKLVKRIDCAEPIFSAPAVGSGRVYFATLGARIYAVSPEGEVAWTWDFVKEEVGFKGNRWLGADWVKFRGRSRNLEGSLRLFTRYYIGRQDRRDARRWADGVRGGCRQETEAAESGGDPKFCRLRVSRHAWSEC